MAFVLGTVNTIFLRVSKKVEGSEMFLMRKDRQIYIVQGLCVAYILSIFLTSSIEFYFRVSKGMVGKSFIGT